MSAPGDADEPRWLRRAAIVLIAAMIVVGWGPRLFWGLWLDETFSVWQAGAHDKLGNPGQSMLFGYIEALFYFPSSRFMEAWLRVPALIAALAGCLLVYRLAQLLVDKRVGLLAVIALVGSPQMIVYATQARAYTLATAACLTALWGLLRWLDGGGRRHGLAFAVSLALAIHFHLLFALFAIVPAFLVVRRAQRKQPVAWRGLCGWCGLTVLLLLPLVPLARRVSQRSDLSFLPLPGIQQLVYACIPPAVLTASIAFLVLWVRDRRSAREGLTGPSVRPVRDLAIVWVFAPPLLLFVVSHLTRQTVLIERYYLHAVAGEALLVAIAFRAFPVRVAQVALLVCFVPVAAFLGIQAWSAPDGPTSWRLPLRTVAAIDPGAAAPVFIQAGHPLSNRIDWEHEPAARSFVYSPLTSYPIPNRVYPLPYDVDERMQRHVRRLADGELASAPVIFLVGVIQHPTNEWVRLFFESRGYASAYPVRQGICLLEMRRRR